MAIERLHDVLKWGKKDRERERERDGKILLNGIF
jgi:hypothetical protein